MLFQYQMLAQQMEQKIRSGEMQAGQRLNSLRQFSAQQRISLNTAKSCYELLEAQGLIYAVNKSGYFVAQFIHTSSLGLPEHPDFQPDVQEVSHLALQIAIQEEAMNCQFIQLGAIQLSPKFLPLDALRRSMQRALKHSQPEDFLYSDKQGHQHLREALSIHWAEDGFYIDPKLIYISNGCMPALSLLIQHLTAEGDSIIVPTPNYNGQLQLLATLKRKIVEIPADTSGIDLQRLEQAMQHSGAKACLMTANFQNPLGFCLSNADKEKIAQLAAQYECPIIEDDIFAECGYTQQRPLPIQYWDQQGYVIYCGSVSKSLSPSYRVGWFCLPQRLRHLHALLLTQHVAVNTPLQLGLADLIYSRAYRQHLQSLKPKLMAQMQMYQDYIAKLFAGVEVRINQPQGSFVLWLQFSEQVSSWEMYCFAQQHGITIVPGLVFGRENRYNNCIRLNAGYALSQEIKAALQLLANWVRDQSYYKVI